MPVPEAAVNEQCGLKFRKNQIGLSGQLFHIQAISQTKAVKAFSDNQFRTRVPAANG